MNANKIEIDRLSEKINEIDEELYQLRQEKDKIGSCNDRRWLKFDEEIYSLMETRREVIRQQNILLGF